MLEVLRNLDSRPSDQGRNPRGIRLIGMTRHGLLLALLLPFVGCDEGPSAQEIQRRSEVAQHIADAELARKQLDLAELHERIAQKQGKRHIDHTELLKAKTEMDRANVMVLLDEDRARYLRDRTYD